MRPIYVEKLSGHASMFMAFYANVNDARKTMEWGHWPSFGRTPQDAVNIFIRRIIEKEGGPVI